MTRYSASDFPEVLMLDARCGYWAAAGGRCWGVQGREDCCLATVRAAVTGAATGLTYVTPKLSKDAAVLKRWVLKWSLETSRSILPCTDQLAVEFDKRGYRIWRQCYRETCNKCANNGFFAAATCPHCGMTGRLATLRQLRDAALKAVAS